jgi:hypothetical protein
MDPNANDTTPSGGREGRYANGIRIGFNAFEVLLDFGQSYPEQVNDVFHTRVITTPHHARLFHRSLGDALTQFEETYGPIPDGDEQNI